MTAAPSPIPGALTRYRVMAFVTGALLLVVTLGMLRYLPGLADLKESLDPTMFVIAQIHGFVYMVYLVTVVHLWAIMKWRTGRLLYMAAGGVVPLLSFFAERRVREDVLATVEAS